MMENALYISPAFVALLLFRYMRNVQARRNDKLRERFWKIETDLVKMLSAQTQNIKDEN